ncbi:uncharacterized protein DS421_3g78490 [Arachis hypogaea]|nr:uncharacterized protein DS421_3g78490 [Arachis hypogaea]
MAPSWRPVLLQNQFGVSQLAAATDSVFLFYGSNFFGFEGPIMVEVEWSGFKSVKIYG